MNTPTITAGVLFKWLFTIIVISYVTFKVHRLNARVIHFRITIALSPTDMSAPSQTGLLSVSRDSCYM